MLFLKIKYTYLCTNYYTSQIITTMSNDIGKRGERIFTVLVSRYFETKGYLFDPIFLGDKYPTVDFYLDLLNSPDKKCFFFVSVKTTTQGYFSDNSKLKIQVSKEELKELIKYPIPVYLFGIDAIEEKGYFTCVNHIDTNSNLNGLSVEFPININSMNLLWEEVKQFWDNTNSIYSFTSKFN
jgi:hypothetical protein